MATNLLFEEIKWDYEDRIEEFEIYFQWGSLRANIHLNDIDLVSEIAEHICERGFRISNKDVDAESKLAKYVFYGEYKTPYSNLRVEIIFALKNANCEVVLVNTEIVEKHIFELRCSDEIERRRAMGE